MSIVQNTQFTGTDQEAEAGEQQYHLCLTSKSRLRATVSKASAWITGPCSRSRHTFSPYHHRVLVLLCVCVYRARTVATLPAHTGRDLSPRLRLTFFPRLTTSLLLFARESSMHLDASGRRHSPLARVHRWKGNGRPCNFLGSLLLDGIRANSPFFVSSRITVVLRFLSGTSNWNDRRFFIRQVLASVLQCLG